MVKAETKQHVTGSPSPYSCDLSPTLDRERRTGKEKRWMEKKERHVEKFQKWIIISQGEEKRETRSDDSNLIII